MGVINVLCTTAAFDPLSKKKNGLRQICVASDCLNVINNIQEVPPSCECMMILQGIEEKEKVFDRLQLVHEGRESNSEAHNLAKFASTLEPGHHLCSGM